MEDLDALNRRTQLPIRIIQDRPHQQKEEQLQEDIRENDQDGYEEQQQTYQIRNQAGMEPQKMQTGARRTRGGKMEQTHTETK